MKRNKCHTPSRIIKVVSRLSPADHKIIFISFFYFEDQRVRIAPLRIFIRFLLPLVIRFKESAVNLLFRIFAAFHGIPAIAPAVVSAGPSSLLYPLSGPESGEAVYLFSPSVRSALISVIQTAFGSGPSPSAITVRGAIVKSSATAITNPVNFFKTDISFYSLFLFLLMPIGSI